MEAALTHASFAHEAKNVGDNERLEFLGDAVLGLIVARRLYERFPDEPEGALSRLRASLVSEPSLARIATAVGIDRRIRLGRGEELSGGRSRPALLADALEAVLGAIYLEDGLDAATEAVDALFHDAYAQAFQGPVSDPKTRLQEYAQARDLGLRYVVTRAQGPAHHPEFEVTVELEGQVRGVGRGARKKTAEQMAARLALQELTKGGS